MQLCNIVYEFHKPYLDEIITNMIYMQAIYGQRLTANFELYCGHKFMAVEYIINIDAQLSATTHNHIHTAARGVNLCSCVTVT